MEPFAITLGGYIGFLVSLIVAIGSISAIRFQDSHHAANRRLYVWILVASIGIGAVLVTNTGGLKKLRLTYQHFDKYCESAHITVNKTIPGVREAYFSNGTDCLGLLNAGYLTSCESPAYNLATDPDKPYERKYSGGSGTVERIEKPQSEYAVMIKGLSTELDSHLGIGYAEKTVLNVRTGEVLATIRWAHTSHGRLPFRKEWCPDNALTPIEWYVFGWANQRTMHSLEGVIERSNRAQGEK